MRLQKYLAQAGVASRRKSEELIMAGKIKLNGQIVTKLGTTIDVDADEVEYQGRVVGLSEKKVYISLNKPAGYVSTTTSKQGQSVLELVDIEERIYPVGRLDKETRGLIILTNDGEFTNKITHPSFDCEKEYEVLIDHELKASDKVKLNEGMMFDGKKLQPVQVSTNDGVNITMILHEGINRQIRRMLGRLGYVAIGIKRIRIGRLKLEGLKEGDWRKIKPEEVI